VHIASPFARRITITKIARIADRLLPE